MTHLISNIGNSNFLIWGHACRRLPVLPNFLLPVFFLLPVTNCCMLISALVLMLLPSAFPDKPTTVSKFPSDILIC